MSIEDVKKTDEIKAAGHDMADMLQQHMLHAQQPITLPIIYRRGWINEDGSETEILAELYYKTIIKEPTE